MQMPLAIFEITNLPTWIKPLWTVGLGGIAVTAAAYVLFLALRTIFPKIAAIAWTTTKEAVSQPLFYLILAGGIFVLILSLFLPYFTFGEDTKVVEENGLTLVMLLGIVLALWTASVSVAEEIEGRTALTVLSKPISRRDFVLGKFLGILGPVVILFIILGVVFLSSVSYKVVYDSRESSQPEPNSAACLDEVARMAPGLALAFLETTVMAAISVAVSTRLAMLPNLVICLSIYVLGHLVPMLAKSAIGQISTVSFIANLLAAVLPVLDHFNMYGAIASSEPVPLAYLGWASLYCLLYSTVAMLVALLLFEGRDLA